LGRTGLLRTATEQFCNVAVTETLQASPPLPNARWGADHFPEGSSVRRTVATLLSVRDEALPDLALASALKV